MSGAIVVTTLKVEYRQEVAMPFHESLTSALDRHHVTHTQPDGIRVNIRLTASNGPHGRH